MALSADVRAYRELGALLKGVEKDVKRELFKAVSSATKPVKAEIRESARRTLPRKGGLNEWVAGAKVTTRQSYSGRNPGVTIKAERDKFKSVSVGGKRSKKRLPGTFGKKSDLGAINRGRVMHPYYGRARKVEGNGLYGPQMVRPGFFTDVMTGVMAQRAKREILTAMQQITNKVTSGSKAA